MTEYVARSGWTDASRGGGQLDTGPVLGIAVHWPGTSTDAYGIESKSTIAARLRSWWNYHVNTRGWSDIGYNFAIDQTGRVWDLRGAGRVGAHCASAAWPEANHYYIGVLLILGDEEQPSAAMLAAFRDFRHAVFFPRFGKDADDITGHGQVRGAQTSCPGPKARAAISNGDLAGNPGGENGGTGMSWEEDLSRGTSGTDITGLADRTLPKAAGRKAAQLLGYAASAFYYVRSAEFRNRVTNRRLPWKKWHVNVQPDLPDTWKNGHTVAGEIQDTFVRVRRGATFVYMRDQQGRAFWSRQFKGEGPSHGLRLARTDETVADLQREVAAIRATVDSIAEAQGLSSEEVQAAVNQAIEDSLLRVQIDVLAQDDTGEDVIAAEAAADDSEVSPEEVDKEDNRQSTGNN